MPHTIHLIREVNVREDSDLIAPTTLWATLGPTDDYAQTGTRIAGPIPQLFADKMLEGLTALLNRLGHDAVIEDAVDD